MSENRPEQGSEGGLGAIMGVFQDLVALGKNQPAYIVVVIVVVIAPLLIVALGREIPLPVILLIGFVAVSAQVLALVSMLREDRPTAPERSPRPEPPEPVEPPTKPNGILFDLSHNQDKWSRQDSIYSLFDLPAAPDKYLTMIDPAGNLTEHVAFHILDDSAQFSAPGLERWCGLVLAMPYKIVMAPDTIKSISDWVHNGGHLVLLGYELGERHHGTYFNPLTDHYFGLRFNSDIVAPADWTTGKPYGSPIIFEEIHSSDPLLVNVNTLCMRNVCTLTVEPGAKCILPLGNNRLSRPTVMTYTDGFTSQGLSEFETISAGVSQIPVIAEAPISLCGKGKVVAIGTWDFFGPDDCFKNSHNMQFMRNLLDWLET